MLDNISSDKPVTRADLRLIIAEELDIAMPVWSEKIVKKLGNKIDKMYTKLDKFIGDIRDKRQVQELHSNDHKRIDTRIRTIETRLGITPKTD